MEGVTMYVHGGVGKHVTMLVDGEEHIDDGWWC